jgi:hypothetical protein
MKCCHHCVCAVLPPTSSPANRPNPSGCVILRDALQRMGANGLQKLDALFRRRHGKGVRKRPLDRLRRMGSRVTVTTPWRHLLTGNQSQSTELQASAYPWSPLIGDCHCPERQLQNTPSAKRRPFTAYPRPLPRKSGGVSNLNDRA